MGLKKKIIFFIKRLFDIIFSGFGLIFLSPIFLIIAVLVRLDSRGPVFFRQMRIGRYGRPFRIYKFRSMYVDVETNGMLVTVEGDSRITRVGRFLRKYKLDELPQLINVFKGEMSFVGPRPEVPKYVEMFKKDFEEILRIRPGITSYTALEFRNEEEVLKKYDNVEKGYIEEILPEKIKMYKRYINNLSLFTDIQMIFLTIWKLVKK